MPAKNDQRVIVDTPRGLAMARPLDAGVYGWRVVAMVVKKLPGRHRSPSGYSFTVVRASNDLYYKIFAADWSALETSRDELTELGIKIGGQL